jgi:hypothetical protein
MKTAVMKRLCSLIEEKKTDGRRRRYIASGIVYCLSQQSHYCRQLIIHRNVELFPASAGFLHLFAGTGWVKACTGSLRYYINVKVK